MEHTGFPSDETLAAFLDGRLDPETRRRVIEHMTTCDECYSVVTASGARNAAQPLLAEAPESGAPRRSVALSRALPVAAVIAASLLLVGPLRQKLISSDSPRTALQIVADAAPPERRLDGRLTGVRYAPLERVTRGEDPNKALAFTGLYAMAGSIAHEATQNPTNENLHAVGLSLLLLGKTDQGIVSLEDLLRRETHESDVTAGIAKCVDSRLLSDLAAAYCDRGRESEKNALDFVHAHDAAERACVLDPLSREAAWNRALAAEQFHVREQVEAAWKAYLTLDDTSDWAREASRRRAAARSSTSESERWPDTVHVMEHAVENADDRALDRVVDAHIEPARAMIVRSFADWAYASLSGDNVKAASARRMVIALGSSLDRVASDDAFGRDMARTISEPMSASAALYGRYFDAAGQAAAGKSDVAQPVLESLLPDLDRVRTPVAFQARMDLSVCALYREDYEKAIGIASNIVAAAAEKRYWHVAGRAAGFEGLALGRVGRPYDAVSAYRVAADAYRRARELGNVATALAFLAEAEFSVGREEESWSHRLASLQLIEFVQDHSWRDGMLVNAAFAAKTGGHRALAVRLLSSAIDGERGAADVGSMHDALVSRGELLYALNQNAAARIDFAQAAALRSHMTPLKRTRATTFANGVEAAAIEQSDPRRALSLFNVTIAEAKRLDLRYTLPELHYGRARALERIGAPISEIIQELRTGVSLLEERAQGGALADRTAMAGEEMYRDIVFMLVKNGQPREALSYSDAYRRYALNDQKRSMTPASALSAAQDPRVATLSYLFARGALLVFVAKGSEVYAVPVSISEDEVAAATDRVWPSKPDFEGSRAKALQELAFLLIKPVERYLDGVSTIGVVPDRSLHRVPFAALTTSDGVPMVARATVVRTRYAVSEVATTSGDAIRPSVLAMGNPTPDQSEFGDLPELRHAEEEARAVAALYPDSTLLLRESATRQAFISRAPRASIVQLSAHGIARSSDPLKAAILLSTDSTSEGGALYVRDILALPLHSVSLVVLSGCETAKAGGTYAGASLADAFLGAGAQNVLATLDDVEDDGATEFITGFHARLAQHIPATEAFSETQRGFYNRAPNDWAWAAFELTTASMHDLNRFQ